MECKFKQNLREELKYQDMTVKQLSLKTGIPIRTLGNYLGTRDSVPPVDNAYLIAKALNVPLEWLVAGEHPMFANKTTDEDTRPLIRDMEFLPEKIKDAFKLIIHFAAIEKKE